MFVFLANVFVLFLGEILNNNSLNNNFIFFKVYVHPFFWMAWSWFPL